MAERRTRNAEVGISIISRSTISCPFRLVAGRLFGKEETSVRFTLWAPVRGRNSAAECLSSKQNAVGSSPTDRSISQRGNLGLERVRRVSRCQGLRARLKQFDQTSRHFNVSSPMGTASIFSRWSSSGQDRTLPTSGHGFESRPSLQSPLGRVPIVELIVGDPEGEKFGPLIDNGSQPVLQAGNRGSTPRRSTKQQGTWVRIPAVVNPLLMASSVERLLSSNGRTPARMRIYMAAIFEWPQKADCDSAHVGSNPTSRPNLVKGEVGEVVKRSGFENLMAAALTCLPHEHTRDIPVTQRTECSGPNGEVVGSIPARDSSSEAGRAVLA